MTDTAPDYAGLIERLSCGASTSPDISSHLRKYQALCDEAATTLRTLLESHAALREEYLNASQDATNFSARVRELERELEMWREVKHSSHWKARAEAAEASLASERAALSAAARVRAEGSAGEPCPVCGSTDGECAEDIPSLRHCPKAAWAVDAALTAGKPEQAVPSDECPICRGSGYDERTRISLHKQRCPNGCASPTAGGGDAE